ncbi:hypothetical protein [Burkholderia seminalis]|uniref:hypothetical protein n=1 Tax=Burkholderia seminalis TaxID=488731 RepID=UPI00159EFC1F|nr:hypothetical protein [Burkholderia seminalis]
MRRLSPQGQEDMLTQARTAKSARILALQLRAAIANLLSANDQGAQILGLTWLEQSAEEPNRFHIGTPFGSVVAAFDIISQDREIFGRYRFFHLIDEGGYEPSRKLFGSLLIDPSGDAKWKSDDYFTWYLQSDTDASSPDVRKIVYRILQELANNLPSAD